MRLARLCNFFEGISGESAALFLVFSLINRAKRLLIREKTRKIEAPPSDLLPKKVAKSRLTLFFIILCSALFVWDTYQEVNLGGPLLTPLQRALLFDTNFSWQGVFSGRPTHFFGAIREGEVYRLFTPALLHANLFHLLFNMAWVLLLGRQIEERVGWFRFLLLILIAAPLANTVQYLVSGPLFLGFSGVVMALAAFIWVRQKKTPWENYPLPRSTSLFLLLYIGALFFIDSLTFLLRFNFKIPIANSAHIAGALSGALLATFPYFKVRGTP